MLVVRKETPSDFLDEIRQLGAQNSKDSAGIPTLCMAISKFRSAYLVEELIKDGAEVNAFSCLNRSALICIAQDWYRRWGNCTAIHFAASLGQHEIVRLLLEHGADMKSKTPKGIEVLDFVLNPFVRCKEGDVKISEDDDLELLKLMKENGLDLNKKDGFSNSVLYRAIVHNCPKIASYLISIGCDVNCVDRFGCTPLHKCDWKSLEYARLLLENNANPNAQDDLGDTVYHHTLRWSKYQDKPSPVKFLDLLHKFQVDPNIQNITGKTALHEYIIRQKYEVNIEVVDFMLQNGADPDITDMFERTPVHYLVMLLQSRDHHLFDTVWTMLTKLVHFAANLNRRDITGTPLFHMLVDCCLLYPECFEAKLWIELLRPQNKVDVNVQDFYNRTVLHLVSAKGDWKVCEILLQYGGNMNIFDCDGNTPLEVAILYKHWDYARKLLIWPSTVDESRQFNGSYWALEPNSAGHKRLNHHSNRGNLMKGSLTLARSDLEHSSSFSTSDKYTYSSLLLNNGNGNGENDKLDTRSSKNKRSNYHSNNVSKKNSNNSGNNIGSKNNSSHNDDITNSNSKNHCSNNNNNSHNDDGNGSTLDNSSIKSKNGNNNNVSNNSFNNVCSNINSNNSTNDSNNKSSNNKNVDNKLNNRLVDGDKNNNNSSYYGNENQRLLRVHKKLQRSTSMTLLKPREKHCIVPLGACIKWTKEKLGTIAQFLAQYGNEFNSPRGKTDCRFFDTELSPEPRIPKTFLTQIRKSSLLRLCEENSLEFHMFERCEEEHCLVAQQVFSLVTDLLKKCSEIDPRMSSELHWTGSSSEGTKMWFPDEFDFLMELIELRGCCYIKDKLVSLEEVILNTNKGSLWSNFCSGLDPCVLSPTKLKDYLSVLLWKAAFELDKERYPNIHFNLCRYNEDLNCFLNDTKVGVNLTVSWKGEFYKNLTVSIDLTPGVSVAISEKQSVELHESARKELFDKCIHVVPYTWKKTGWRPSFSLIEVRIVKNLTKRQISLYKCLKFFRDLHEDAFEHIPSYHLKTFLLGTLFHDPDEEYLQYIERECFYSSACLVLFRLKQIVGCPEDIGSIQHFFLKSSLRLSNYDLRWCKSVLDRLESHLTTDKRNGTSEFKTAIQKTFVSC